MIRSSLCLVLALASVLTVIPTGSHAGTPNQLAPALQLPLPSTNDPNGTKYAFNSTLGHFDLYRQNNATWSLPLAGNLTWFSKLNRTMTPPPGSGAGQPIPGTAFRFNMSGPNLTQKVNFTLTIPGGTGVSTFLKLDWNGTVGTGTSARYLLSNSTKVILNVFARTTPGNFTGGPPLNSTGSIPITCGTTDECFDVTRFVGFNLTLTFLFNSTATGGKLKATVSNVEVVSVDNVPTPTSSHYMFVNPRNPTDIIHRATMLLTYNSTTHYPRPNTSPQKLLNHTWGQMLVSFYMPRSYRLNNATLDGTQILNATYPFNQGTCLTKVPLECFNSVFVSLNMTLPFDKGVNRTAFFTAETVNAVNSIRTSLGSVSTDYWTPGENMTVVVNNQPGVNNTGPQFVYFTSPNGISPVNNSTVSQGAKAGVSNYTVTLPTSPLGSWSVTTVFLPQGGADLLPINYGILSHKFRIEEIKPATFSVTGAAGGGASVNIDGSLGYATEYPNNSTAAGNVNATVFGISTGPGASLVYTNGTSSSGLYISSITLVNGIATVGSPVTMYLNLKNPTGGQFSANLTIEHEWSNGQTHGVYVTIPLKLGDDPFQTPPLVYTLQALLTQNGIQLTIQSLQTKNQKTAMMTTGLGASAVPLLRQHFGLFKMSLHVKNASNQVVPTTPVESPPYAYLVYTPLVPGQIRAYSPVVTTRFSDGHFNTTVTSDRLLGANSLIFIVLARDSNGIVLGDANNSPQAAADSTFVISTADVPDEVTIQQSVTVTIHLKSNSTILSQTMNVNLDVTGSTNLPTQTQSATVAHGQTQSVAFTFTAPSTGGLYLVTFSSPQYGGPLFSKTLKVSLVASNLQILLPAAIGVVAAIVILAIYVVQRGPAEEVEPQEKGKGSAAKPTKSQSSSKPLTET